MSNGKSPRCIWHQVTLGNSGRNKKSEYNLLDTAKCKSIAGQKVNVQVKRKGERGTWWAPHLIVIHLQVLDEAIDIRRAKFYPKEKRKALVSPHDELGEDEKTGGEKKEQGHTKLKGEEK